MSTNLGANGGADPLRTGTLMTQLPETQIQCHTLKMQLLFLTTCWIYKNCIVHFVADVTIACTTHK